MMLGVVAACGLLGLLMSANAQAVDPAGAPRSTVAGVVAGIVSYTRWPGDAAAIRLCTLGRGPSIDELLRAVEIGSSQRAVAVRAVASAAQARDGCQAVYVSGIGAAAGRDLLQLLAGQPVLLLGEGLEFCSDGGMFCLEPGASTVRFNANLDAIARSGLRVNPLVLRIARGATGGGS
jgi:hypothetical protein